MIKTIRRICSIIFSIVTLFVIICLCVGVTVKAVPGIGTVKDTYSRTILPDMVYTYTDSNNGSPQKNYVIEYNPKTSGVKAIAMYGEYEFGGDPISANVALAQSRGETVIAGVNASPFDTSNGVTVGTIISEGRIVSANSGTSGYDSFAIRNDGTMFIGRSNLTFKYTTPNGTNVNVNTINKQKKTANDKVYLFSSDYYTDSTTLAESTEAVLTYVSGDLSIGKSLKLKVESIKDNTTRTPIEKGKYVLTGPNLAKLGNINVGDELTFTFTSNDTTYDWNDVANSICGFYQILKDGAVMANIDSDSSIHPRTTIGFKANGEIVLYVVDGRQPNFSIGLSDRACAEYMANLGCVDAIRMDGGGSSAMTIRFPGDEKLTTVNSPSDGQERHDSDCLLLVLSSEHDSTVGDDYLLHAYPNSIKLLQNTVTDITVKATDTKYNPKPVPEYIMTVEGDCGKIVDGRFQARNGEGTGKVKITGANTETEVRISVTDKVSELYASVNNIAMGPNEEFALSVKAYYNNELLIASNEAFTWTCDSAIGTINEKGIFKSSDVAGQSGYIHVAYGSVTAKVLVTVGQLPIEITGFENDTCGDGAGAWRNNQVNGGSGSCSINSDLTYVRYGEKSLRVDFNLANTTGTVGTQISSGSNLRVTGSPTAIGMWVYATPSAYGAWIRMQYTESGSTGAKYADFGHVDWEGWKYLEAKFDEGISYPVSIQYLIRIMGVSASERIDGTIYIDGLRAVYGFSNDDFDLPVVANIKPDNYYTDLTTQTISFDATDTGVGINKDKTTLSIDGKKLDNLLFKEIPDGYTVSWTPSYIQPLNEGHHVFTLRVEDHSGNFLVKSFDMFVGGGLLEISNTYKKDVKVDNTEKVDIDVNLTDFTKMELNISFNSEEVEVLEILASSGITLQRKVVNKSKQLIIIKLINDGYTGDGKGIVSFTYKPIKEGTASFSYTLVEFSRTPYGDIVLTYNPSVIEVSVGAKVDYAPLLEAINAINYDLSGKELLDIYTSLFAAYEKVLEFDLSFDENSTFDDEIKDEVLMLIAKIKEYNEYVNSVNSALASVFGE